MIYEETSHRPGNCNEATVGDQLLRCRFFNRTYNYDAKVVHNQIEYACTFSKEACKVTMVPIFCLLGDARVEPGAGFAMGKLYYMCSLDESNMGIRAIGCATVDGKRVQPGQKYRFNNSTLHCQMADGKIVAVFIGCDNGNGIVKLGEFYVDGKTIARCQEDEKLSFFDKRSNSPNNQRGKGNHPAHDNPTVSNPTNPAPSMGGAIPKPSVNGQHAGWFCMDSSISTACQFTVSGKRYLLNRGYGQWIGRRIYFCEGSAHEAASLCVNS
ncbi:hypothetical protein TTRE_0000548701 [Trichuris trichiura]|uniref:Abnormal cell migration protein 18-like fibronectin type I domain-containing protein n=1 Tax=Trichuris trichiura TaxID=36087 RepID=A0A077Z9Z3_TRITR|nr:hypothetical protein TTRE_0000548701 [Trichuris trichiura]